MRQRKAAEAEQAVEGQPAESAERVLRRPRMPARSFVDDAGLPKADEGPQSAQEPVALRQRPQGRHDLPIHQAEVAGIERDVEIADAAQEAIEDEVAGPLPERLLRFVRIA